MGCPRESPRLPHDDAAPSVLTECYGWASGRSDRRDVTGAAEEVPVVRTGSHGAEKEPAIAERFDPEIAGRADRRRPGRAGVQEARSIAELAADCDLHAVAFFPDCG